MNYNVTYELTPEQFAQIVGPLYGPLVFLSVILSIALIIAEWKVFEKAGVEGWKCLIPIYSAYKLTEIGCGNGWLFLLLLIPFVNIAFLIWFEIQLAKAYGQPGLFAVGLIFLNSVFMMILGYGSAQYVGPKGISSNVEF